MITHFLGPQEVEGYAADLAMRLTQLEADFPTTWFLLGQSGIAFANLLLNFIPDRLHPSIRLVRVDSNRDTGRVRFIDSVGRIPKAALLLDSAVHSGKSMLAAARKLSDQGVKNLITYSLVLKRNSALIPNFFGVVIEETDRCLFQLDRIPNNRLCEKPPIGILRELSPKDVDNKFIRTRERAIDSTTFGDLLYEKERGSHVYVYEHRNRICGVLSFAEKDRAIFVDLVANSAAYRGKGIGAALMRWAETWARSMQLEAIELWAIKRRVKFYQDRDFQPLGREINLGQATYLLMRRKLLYNLNLVDPTNIGRS